MTCFFVFLFQAINVCVPFIFKYAVDYLGDSSNFLDLSSAPTAIVTVATGSMLICTLNYTSFLFSNCKTYKFYLGKIYTSYTDIRNFACKFSHHCIEY